MLAVSTSCRKRGIGSKLVCLAVQRMAATGCDEAMLETEVRRCIAGAADLHVLELALSLSMFDARDHGEACTHRCCALPSSRLRMHLVSYTTSVCRFPLLRACDPLSWLFSADQVTNEDSLRLYGRLGFSRDERLDRWARRAKGGQGV